MLRKLAIYISGFILIILILIGIVVRFFTTPIIKNQLDTFIESDQSDIYQYSYDKVKVRLGMGIVAIEGPKVSLKDGAIDRLKQHEFKDLDEFEASSIEIDIDVPAYLFKRRIVVEDINIINPDITVNVSKSYLEPELPVEREPMVISDIFSRSFTGLDLNSFKLRGAKFKLIDVDSDSEVYALDSINIYFKDVKIDSTTLAEENLGITFKEVDLSTGDLALRVGDSYELKTDGIDLDLIAPTDDDENKYAQLLLKKFEYWPVDVAIDSLVDGTIRSLFGIKVDSLKISNFNLDELMDQRLVLDELIISEPSFLQHVNPNITKVKKSKASKKAGPVLDGILDEIIIKEFSVENGKLELYNRKEERSDVEVKKINMNFTDLSITEDKELVVDYSQGVIDLGDIESVLNEYYVAQVDRGKIDLVKGDISFSSFKMNPQFSEDEFFEKLGFETDRFTVDLNRLSIKGIDLDKLVDDLDIKAKEIVIGDLNLDIYRNKWIEDPEFKYMPLPATMIGNLPMQLWIDTLFIKNTNITYRQRGDLVEYEDEKPMEVKFKEMNAKLYVLTNDKNYRKNNPTMFMTADMVFMDTTVINATYEFNMNSPIDQFKVFGDMTTMHTSSLEPVLHNVMLLDIPDGMIYKAEFDFIGNDSLMTGTFDMQYKNLGVDIIKKNNVEKSSGFWNGIANTVIRKNNVPNRGKYIQGQVFAERKRNKSVFNFTWQGVKAGIIYTVSPIRTAKMKGKKKPAKKNKNSTNP